MYDDILGDISASGGIFAGTSLATWDEKVLDKSTGYFVQGNLHIYVKQISLDLMLGESPFPNTKVLNLTTGNIVPISLLRFNMGASYYPIKGKKLNPYIGLSYGSYSDNITSDKGNGQYSINSKTSIAGLSPRAGVQFKLIPTISLSADISYHFASVYMVQDNVQKATPVPYCNIGLGLMYHLSK